MPNRGDESCSRNEDGGMHSESEEKAGDVFDPDSNSYQDLNKSKSQEAFNIFTKPYTCSSAASEDKPDVSQMNAEDIPVMRSTSRIMEVNEENVLATIGAARSESPDVFRSEVPPPALGEIKHSVASTDDSDTQSRLDIMVSGHITEKFISTSLSTEEALYRDSTSALDLELFDSDNLNESKSPKVSSLKESTEARIPIIDNVSSPLQSESFEALKEQLSETKEIESQKMQPLENTGTYRSDVLGCIQEKELIEITEKGTGFSTVSAYPESEKSPLETYIKAPQSETFKADTDERQQDEYSDQVSRSPDKVFSILLDLQSFDIRQSGYFGAIRPDGFRWSEEAQHCTAEPEEISNTGFLEKEQRFSPKLSSPELDGKQKDSQSTLLVSLDAEQKGSGTQLENKENQTIHILNKDEALTLSKSCCTGIKRELGVELSAETTFPVSKTEVTIRQSGDKAEIAAPCLAEDLVPSREKTETETQMDATNNKKLTVTDTAMNTGGAGEGAAQGGGANDSDCTDGKHCAVNSGLESTSWLNEEKKWKPNEALKEIVLAQERVSWLFNTFHNFIFFVTF